MKAHDDTLEHFLASLQFKLGHIAGNAQQLLDLLAKQDFEHKTKVRKLTLEVQDAALHISAALKGLSK